MGGSSVAMLLMAYRNILRYPIKHVLLGMLFALVTLLMAIGLSFNDAAVKAREDLLRDQTANTQLRIQSANEKSRYFHEGSIAQDVSSLDGVLNVIPYLSSSTVFSADESLITVVGSSLADMNEAYPFDIVSGDTGVLQDKRAAVVCEEFAHEHGLVVGDTLTFMSGERERSFSLVAICKLKGQLVNKDEVFVQIGEARELFGYEDECTSIGVSIASLDSIAEISESVANMLPAAVRVQSAFDSFQYDTVVTSISLSLMILVGLGICVSAILSYSTFRTFVYGNLHEMGTLQCLGFTSIDVIAVYVVEFALSAIPGTFVGSACAAPLMNVLTGMAFGVPRALPFGGIALGIVCGLLVMAVLLGPIVLLVHSYLGAGPVNLIRGAWSESATPGILCSTLLLVFALLLLGVSKTLELHQSIASFMDVIAPLVSVGGFALLAQAAVPLSIAALDFIIRLVTCRRSVLLTFMRFNGGSSMSSVATVALGLGMALACISLGDVIARSSEGVYAKSDIRVNVYEGSDFAASHDAIVATQGIDTSARVQKTTVKLNDRSIWLYGIDPDEYEAASFETFSDDIGFAVLKEKGTGLSPIVISDTLARTIGCGVGDKLELVEDGRRVSYIVADTMGTFEEMGRVAFIRSDDFEKEHSPRLEAYLISIKEGVSPDTVCDRLNGALESCASFFSVDTVSSLLEGNTESNRLVFAISYVVIGMVVAITVVGLINNTIVRIMEQRRTFALRQLLGQTFGGIAATLLAEGAVLGLTSGLCALAIGAAALKGIVAVLHGFVGSVAQGVPILTAWPVLLAVGVFESSYLLSCPRLMRTSFTDILRNGE